MAKVKKKKVSETRYKVTLSQEEFDVLSGIISDLNDNPQRKVTMKYHVDDTEVIPTKRGMRAIKGLAAGFALTLTQGEDYDYFDYWKDYKDEA